MSRTAMNRLCDRIEEKGIELGGMNALEFFAREGNWHTIDYSDRVKELHAWEINEACKPGLERNLPSAHITIGDSFELARVPEHAGMFDFIVLDNPQGLFGQQDCYCEHFEALELVPDLMPEKGIIVFNVNRQPYNYGDHPRWQEARERFYGRGSTDRMDIPFLIDWYEDFFYDRGLNTVFSFDEDRNGFVSYLVYSLARV